MSGSQRTTPLLWIASGVSDEDSVSALSAASWCVSGNVLTHVRWHRPDVLQLIPVVHNQPRDVKGFCFFISPVMFVSSLFTA